MNFIQLDEENPVEVPSYETTNSAGMDIRSIEDHRMYSGNFRVIKTGLSVDMEDGYELQVRSRSGLAAKHGVCVLNAPGTIDADYKGELLIILMNYGQLPFVIKKGDRIAQLVYAKVEQAPTVHVKDVLRVGGLGSTGRD